MIRPIRKDLGDLRDVMVSATEPTVRNDGDALQTNDVWLDVGNDLWKVYDGSAFQTIGGGGSVAVDDDGTEVVAAASGLNFGTGLSVTDDGGGDVTIDSWTLVESAQQAGFDDTTDAGAILAVYRWGVDGSGDPYFDSAGVTAGEEAALWLNDNDEYALVELDL